MCNNRYRFFRNLLATVCVITFSILGAFPGIFRPRPARAASMDQLQAQQKDLQAKIQQYHQQALNQKDVAANAQARLDLLSNQTQVLQDSITSTDGQIGDVQAKINDQEQQIAELESQKRKVEDQQSAILRQYWKMYVTQESDLLEAMSGEPLSARQERQAQIESLKKSLEQVIAKTNEAKLAVQKTKDDLQQKADSLTALKTQQEQQQRDLADTQDSVAALKDNAVAAETDLEAKERQARVQESQIEAEVSRQVAAATAARAAAVRNAGGNISAAGGTHVNKGDVIGYEGSTGNSTGPHVHFELRINGTPVDPTPYVGSVLRYPLDPGTFIISQGFGWTSYAASGAYGGAIHTGIDLAGPYGSPVHAAASGVIILNQWYGGYGHAVAIELPNGWVVLCGHMI